MKCSEKTVYYTEAEAKKACKKLWKNSFVRRYYYKCHLCHNYHLTKTDPNNYAVRQYTRDVDKYLNK